MPSNRQGRLGDACSEDNLAMTARRCLKNGKLVLRGQACVQSDGMQLPGPTGGGISARVRLDPIHGPLALVLSRQKYQHVTRNVRLADVVRGLQGRANVVLAGLVQI